MEAGYPLQRLIQQAAETHELPAMAAAEHAAEDNTDRRLRVCDIIDSRLAYHRARASAALSDKEKETATAEAEGFVHLEQVIQGQENMLELIKQFASHQQNAACVTTGEALKRKMAWREFICLV